MSRLFWITVVLVLVSVFLSQAIAAAASDEAATAKQFCEAFLAADDESIIDLMDEPMQAAMTPQMSQQVRDAVFAAMGPLEKIGDGWHVDEVQGYRRYRVPVRFRDGMQDLLIAFAPDGRVGGMFTVDHLPRPTAAPADVPVDAGEGEEGEASFDAQGDWLGRLEIPDNALEIAVRLIRSSDAWSGTIDIPAQGLMDHPLSGIEVTANRVVFKISGAPGDPTFKGTLSQNKLAGIFTQSGATLTFALERGEKPEVSRPQTPRPPFDYVVEDVTYKNGEIVRAGTLTTPRGGGPFPAILLLSGSGAQDRDSQLFGHRPFLLWADHLTRAGVAVLRVDDRGVGGSSGNLSQSTISDFAEDALAGVRFLAARKEIDATRIGLLGHSEGGIVAPLAASRSSAVAYLVLLAGTGVPGAEVMDLQMQAHLKLLGFDDEAVAKVAVENRELHRLIGEGATAVALKDQLVKLKQSQGDPSAVTPSDVAGFMTPWMQSFVTHDPRTALADVKIPVLVLNGELDFQVAPDQNLEAIRSALKHNPEATFYRLPELNHLLQTAKTGALAEYGQIEETVAPQVLDLVKDWIVGRFSSSDDAPN